MATKPNGGVTPAEQRRVKLQITKAAAMKHAELELTARREKIARLKAQRLENEAAAAGRD